MKADHLSGHTRNCHFINKMTAQILADVTLNFQNVVCTDIVNFDNILLFLKFGFRRPEKLKR